MRKLLITISIITSSLFLHAGQSVDSILTFADSQYNRGNFNLALKEYQRIGFHVGFTDPYLLYKLGNCYLNKGEWVNARNYYDQVIRTATHDSLLVDAEIKKISSLIREKSYKKALISLFGIPDSTYQSYRAEVDLLLAITYFGMEDFTTSKQYFQKMVPDDPVALARIDCLFKEKKLLKRPYPNLAYAMSMIIPGTGQIYSGEIADGINSFLLNEALVVLSIFVAYEYTIMDAIISVLPWYYRYYSGGLENARESAIEERQRRRSLLYKETLQIIRESSEE